MTDTPQLENGYTPIANEIVEALMKVNLSPYESRVLWFLFRKTYGWNKKTDRIALSQFSERIGLDRRLVHRAIRKLSSKKMIVINKDDTFKIRYGFQKDYRKWKLSSKKMTVINRDDEVSSVEIPTKETIQKKRDIIPYKKIIDYLNEKAGTHFKHNTNETKRLIKARFNQGFDISAFQYVIDLKCKQWLTNEKMINYLRPQTLFGTKFEGYLNERS